MRGVLFRIFSLLGEAIVSPQHLSRSREGPREFRLILTKFIFQGSIILFSKLVDGLSTWKESPDPLVVQINLYRKILSGRNRIKTGV